jgi:hypothetical protein
VKGSPFQNPHSVSEETPPVKTKLLLGAAIVVVAFFVGRFTAPRSHALTAVAQPTSASSQCPELPSTLPASDSTFKAGMTVYANIGDDTGGYTFINQEKHRIDPSVIGGKPPNGNSSKVFYEAKLVSVDYNILPHHGIIYTVEWDMPDGQPIRRTSDAIAFPDQHVLVMNW